MTRVGAARTVLVTGSLIAAGAHLGPAASSLAPLRRVLAPRLAGVSRRRHVALTYDDGPDPASTPSFLELLAQRRVTATFFLLGAYAECQPLLVREMSEAGHELAVHGWRHTCTAARRPGLLAGELQRSREFIEDLTGQQVRWYRPPYGVITGESLVAARRTGLETVLWSTWGRDWSRHATPGSIVRTVSRPLRPGGTVLLHDTDRTSAPGSWRRTLAATALLLDRWADLEVAVGPLREHW